LGRLPVNPFALGAAFVERAVELGWVEIEADGIRSSYYVTDSGNEKLADFGVKLEKAMQFAVLPERNNSGPRKRPFPIRMQSRPQAHPGHKSRGQRPKRHTGHDRRPQRRA
jgi:hypothetical protein